MIALLQSHRKATEFHAGPRFMEVSLCRGCVFQEILAMENEQIGISIEQHITV